MSIFRKMSIFNKISIFSHPPPTRDELRIAPTGPMPKAPMNAIEKVRKSGPLKPREVDREVARNPNFAPLDNPVHPLFRYSAWRNIDFDMEIYALSQVDLPQNNITKECYARLLPALQLATILLEKAAPLLIRIRRGPIEKHRDGTRSLDVNWEPNSADWRRYEKDLLRMAKTFRITYRRAKVPCSSGITMAVSSLRPNADARADAKAAPIVPIMALTADHLIEFDSDDLWSKGDAYSKCTLRVQLADHLLHELAHCLHYERMLERTVKWPNMEQRLRQLKRTPEPRIWPETYVELGTSVTKFIWGNCNIFTPDSYYRTKWDGPHELQVQRPRWDGAYGLIIFYRNNDNDPNSAEMMTVCKESHIDFLNKYTWEAPQARYYVRDARYNRFRLNFNDQPVPKPLKVTKNKAELLEDYRKFNARHGLPQNDSLDTQHFDLFMQEVYEGNYNTPHNDSSGSSSVSFLSVESDPTSGWRSPERKNPQMHLW